MDSILWTRATSVFLKRETISSPLVSLEEDGVHDTWIRLGQKSKILRYANSAKIRLSIPKMLTIEGVKRSQFCYKTTVMCSWNHKYSIQWDVKFKRIFRMTPNCVLQCNSGIKFTRKKCNAKNSSVRQFYERILHWRPNFEGKKDSSVLKNQIVNNWNVLIALIAPQSW